MDRASVEPVIVSGNVRVRLQLAYDGSGFHGFAYQRPEIRTVAGELRGAIESIYGIEPDVTCAGRTDAGVHAWGQVVHFDIDVGRLSRTGLDRMPTRLNRLLGPSIVVRLAEAAGTDFHARFSAKERHYRYSILRDRVPDPFLAATTWWIPEPMDIEAMNEACRVLLGEHDFAAFCRRGEENASLTRHIIDAHWHSVDERVVRFDIAANAFCHQMVRSLTGMLVAIGTGRRAVDEMAAVLESRDRARAAHLAPPQGLCLWNVVY